MFWGYALNFSQRASTCHFLTIHTNMRSIITLQASWTPYAIRLSTIFLIFSDCGIVFSGKFYVDYICLDIFLSHFWCFTWFLNNSCKKIQEKCQNFRISRKPPYSILRAETWQKFIFCHNEYVCKISAKSEHPIWRRLYIWRQITHKQFLIKLIKIGY